jgi:peptidoglycan hydrolase CwlO-like protein
MENKPTRKSRKPAAADNIKPISPIIGMHSELMNEKISQIVSLQNGLSANEKMLDTLNEKIKEYSKQVMELKADNVRVRTLHNNLDYNCKHAYEQIARLPKFIKWLYNIH